MDLKRRVIRAVVTYIVQVGALWGLLEGFTHFKGEALKTFLGRGWVLIYILPLLSTAYIMFRELHEEEVMKKKIKTSGDFSPGEVAGNYSIGDGKDATDTVASQATKLRVQDSSLTKTISTEGHYSPAEVGGSYAVRVAPEILSQAFASNEDSEPDNAVSTSTKSDEDILTKGNFSPGQVGGDYKIEQG